jgi:RNA polymerase sigma factor (sigma-70 family)
MTDSDTLAERFEKHRDHLRAVAYRVLGSRVEADDAVQETWLRLSRAETEAVDNLRAWLTTVVARVCLDMLRARRSRREDLLPATEPPQRSLPGDGPRPDGELLLADSVGLALLVVLETLSPAERIAFVLHDLFDLPFEDIAPIVERSPTATRQLASRARRRVQGGTATTDADPTRQRQIVDAIMAAARDGDFEGLLTALAPDVVLRADPAAIQTAAARASRGAPALSPEVRGARAVAESLRGKARGARPALVDGLPGAAWAPDGTPLAVFVFTLAHGKIAAIDIIMDPTVIAELGVQLVDG